ncbi:hypothetical protein [Ruegeria sp. HKCCE4148]|uniref:hypothetical protein n=1 Tax=Ruegeria sp. HKCCE4148 TaxID=2794829 RepID=UPI001AE3A528|nr:hypothetical protein [Ruegeria sp. HKCCE4148]
MPASNGFQDGGQVTVSPSINVSATIRAFNSAGQFRLPSARRGILARNSLVACLSSNDLEHERLIGFGGSGSL